jgi:hypothetical protein
MMTHKSRRALTTRLLPIALAVTVLSTVGAAASPAGCNTFYGAFPCDSSGWGRCYDDYRDIFPCSTPGHRQHGR